MFKVNENYLKFQEVTFFQRLERKYQHIRQLIRTSRLSALESEM